MKRLYAMLLLAMATVAAVPLFSQSKTITIHGRITSFEESLPLEGVSIRLKNGKTSTGTQADGSFSLPVLPEDKILLVSLAGYEKKEIALTGVKEYDIVLKRTDNFRFNARVVAGGLVR